MTALNTLREVHEVSRPRVVHFVVAGDIGGAERVVADLAAPRLTESTETARHCVALISPNDGLRAFFARHNVRVWDKGRCSDSAAAFVQRAFLNNEMRWLLKVIGQEGAQVVHLHTFGAHLVGVRAAVRACVPVLRTEHSVAVYSSRLCWPWSRWSLRRATYVTAVSQHVANVALRRAPFMGKRLEVIANGVDVVLPSDTPSKSVEAPFRFVLVARLEPRKGVDLALQALALVPNATLDIVGDGQLYARLRALCTRLGLAHRVTFHGYLADPATVVAKADAAVSSSRAEGLSLVLLEAMAQGKPAVATPVGGMVEFVRHRETGWLATVCTAEALACAMKEAASSRALARRLGENARNMVAQEYSRAQMCRAYDNVYQRLVSQHAHARAAGGC